MKLTISGALAAGVLAAFVATAPATAQSVSLTLAHQYPETQPMAKGYNDWASDVEEASGGDISVRVHPGSTLIGSSESFSAVASGSVDLSNMIGGFQVGDIPELAAIGMPFLFEDYDHYRRTLDGGLFEMIQDLYEAKGIKLLNYFPKGNVEVFHKSKFVMTPADFKGLQIRSTGGTNDLALAELGANVVRLPTTEVTSGLQRGMVDAIVTNCFAHIGRSWYEQTPYASLLSLANDGEGLGINLDVWNGLTPEQQEIMLDTAATMEDYEWEMIQREESEGCFEDWAERGVEVQVATPEQRVALREELEPVYGTVGAEVPFLDKVLELVEANR